MGRVGMRGWGWLVVVRWGMGQGTDQLTPYDDVHPQPIHFSNQDEPPPSVLCLNSQNFPFELCLGTAYVGRRSRQQVQATRCCPYVCMQTPEGDT